MIGPPTLEEWLRDRHPDDSETVIANRAADLRARFVDPRWVDRPFFPAAYWLPTRDPLVGIARQHAWLRNRDGVDEANRQEQLAKDARWGG